MTAPSPATSRPGHAPAPPNRFQRWYFDWAATYYARMPQAVREQAEAVDRYLYSRRGLWVWGAVLGTIALSTLLLARAGLPMLLALLSSLLVWGGLPVAVLAAWLMPEQFAVARMKRFGGRIVLFGLFGAALGFTVGHVGKHGSLQPLKLMRAFADALTVVVPLVLLMTLAMMALLWMVARLRQRVTERELARLALEHERDTAARQAAEARLALLQAQIQPHFIFNTLAALQHWVDSGDARAGPLLRSLTTFLRGSTEMLAREQATLAEEAALAARYLEIMQARLGDRLQQRIEISPAAAAQSLPPGLLLTLVENAVEHGIAPSLRGGTVRVTADCAGTQCRLSVQDDGAGLAADWQEGLGLGNCRQRLRHRHGDTATLQLGPSDGGAGTQAQVCWPVPVQNAAA